MSSYLLIVSIVSITIGLSYGLQRSNDLLDLSLNQYTEDGTVEQLSYSERVVEKSLPSIAFIDSMKNCCVLISLTDSLSLRDANSMRKINVIEDSIGVLMAGYPQDCIFSLNQLNSLVKNHKLQFGEIISLMGLCHRYSSFLSNFMYEDSKFARPFAVSTIVCKYELKNLKLKLLAIKSNGLIIENNFFSQGSIPPIKLEEILKLVSTSFEDIRQKIRLIAEILMDQSSQKTQYGLEYLICGKDGLDKLSDTISI